MKKRDHENIFSIYLSFVVLIAFMIYAAIIKNVEFFYYGLIIIPSLFFVFSIRKKIKLKSKYVTYLSLAAILNFIGGLVRINGVRLYDISIFFLGYDYIVHFLFSFIMVFIIYGLFGHYFKFPKKFQKIYMFIILTFLVAGMSTIVEMLELIGVIYLNSPGVGGYVNNSLDLIFNLLGAIVASLVIVFGDDFK